MAYVVKLTAPALRDAEEHSQYILEHSNDDVAANKWRSGLLEASEELASFPASFPRIPESIPSELELRQRLFHSHRLIFRVLGNTVEVLRVYPSAARPLRNLAQRPKYKKSL